MRERHREVPGVEIQAAVDQGQWALGVGIDQVQVGIRGPEEGTIQEEHHMGGNPDQEGREEGVQIAVRKVGRNPAGIEAAGGIQEGLGQLPGEAGEGHGEEDSEE